MGKPTELQLNIALKACIEMKEHNNDPDFIARSLLNHHYRLRYLEEVLQTADRFMNHGMADHERMHLIRCIEKAKEAEYKTAGEDHNDFGL